MSAEQRPQPGLSEMASPSTGSLMETAFMLKRSSRFGFDQMVDASDEEIDRSGKIQIFPLSISVSTGACSNLVVSENFNQPPPKDIRSHKNSSLGWNTLPARSDEALCLQQSLQLDSADPNFLVLATPNELGLSSSLDSETNKWLTARKNRHEYDAAPDATPGESSYDMMHTSALVGSPQQTNEDSHCFLPIQDCDDDIADEHSNIYITPDKSYEDRSTPPFRLQPKRSHALPFSDHSLFP
jgi:hypothetical protein